MFQQNQDKESVISDSYGESYGEERSPDAQDYYARSGTRHRSAGVPFPKNKLAKLEDALAPLVVTLCHNLKR